jgi:hypothetical protein
LKGTALTFFRGLPFLFSNVSKEKKAFDELWAARSGGTCLFVMPTERDYAAVFRLLNTTLPFGPVLPIPIPRSRYCVFDTI